MDINVDPDVERFKAENAERIKELRQWASEEYKPADADLPNREEVAIYNAKARAKLEDEWFKYFEHPKKEQFRNSVLMWMVADYVKNAAKKHFLKPLQEP